MPNDLTPVPVKIVHRNMRLAQMPVPAGFPSPAGDDLEDSIDPISWVVRRESTTFWWKIEGDSLEAAGILDGDMIAIDRAGHRRNGWIALAVVDGSMTVKKLAKRGDEWFLDPCARHDTYKPIKITETTEIWGVAAGTVRRYPID